jgi:hypothetical protein
MAIATCSRLCRHPPVSLDRSSSCGDVYTRGLRLIARGRTHRSTLGQRRTATTAKAATRTSRGSSTSSRNAAAHCQSARGWPPSGRAGTSTLWRPRCDLCDSRNLLASGHFIPAIRVVATVPFAQAHAAADRWPLHDDEAGAFQILDHDLRHDQWRARRPRRVERSSPSALETRMIASLRCDLRRQHELQLRLADFES